MTAEWMPTILEASISCPLNDINNCEFMESGQNSCADCPLVKLAQRKLLEYLIAHFWSKDETVQNILKSMLKQLEKGQ